MASRSSRFSHREDADSLLATTLEINRSAGRQCEGEVIRVDGAPEIARCPRNPSAPAQVVGYRCFGCGEIHDAREGVSS